MKKLSILIAVCVLTLTMLSGCASKPSGAEKDSSSTSGASAQTADNSETGGQSAKNSEQGAASSWKAVLYLPDAQGMYVYKEEKEITVSAGNTGKLSVEDKAKFCIQELINSGKTSIPKTAKLLSVHLDKDTLTVDFSREFDKDHNGGSTGVNMTMAPLVLTLTELEGVSQVSFTIEGKVLSDFKGHIEFNRPFKRAEYEQFIGK